VEVRNFAYSSRALHGILTRPKKALRALSVVRGQCRIERTADDRQRERPKAAS